MADLFTVTAPLAIRFKDGNKQIMIKTYRHNDGLAFLPPFWNQLPEEKMFQFVAGPVKGEGPWKVGDAVVTVLGCHGTDPDLASLFSEWQTYQEQFAEDYPDEESIAALAAKCLMSSD